jgi:hypothetical protein
MYHISNLGKFSYGVTADINGYVPFPGDSLDDFTFDLGSCATDDDEWFADLCTANQRATEEAERVLTEWQSAH